MTETTWGQRISPYTPTAVELRLPALAVPTWTGGPEMGQLIHELQPVIRSYLLLGYRCSGFLIFDYSSVGPDQSPPAGARIFDLDAGLAEDSTTIHPGDLTDPALPSLAGEHLHLAFQLEPFADMSDAPGQSAATGVRPYSDHGVPLAPEDRVISLAATGLALADLQAALDTKLAALFARIEALWPSGPGTANDSLPKTAQGGMLWLFDPAHWQGTDAGFESGRTQARNLLKWFFPYAGHARQFLLEQIFDIRLRGPSFFKGQSAATVASAASLRRAPGQRADPNSPNLGYYAYSPPTASVAVPGDLGVEQGEFYHDRRVAPEIFVQAVKAIVERQGNAHVLSYNRWGSLDDAGVSWLDAILALGWEGAINIPEAVHARPPPRPWRLERTQETAGQKILETWILHVHDTPVLSFDRPFYGSEEGEFVGLAGRLAFEYLPGGPSRKTTLRIVAGRGIAIHTLTQDQPREPYGAEMKPHYEAVMRLYNMAHPWDLEIYRVQNDAWIPPLGAAIQTEWFMAPNRIDPSPPANAPEPGAPPPPDGEEPDYHTPLISAIFPLNFQRGTGAYDALIKLGVLITPTPWGEKITFPVSDIVGDSHIPPDPDLVASHKPTNSVGTTWEFTVNPFSGSAGYTYDLFLESYEYEAFNVLTLHVVAITTDDTYNDVHARTTLTADRSIWRAAYDYMTDPVNNPQPERTLRFALDGLEGLLDSSAEFWKIPNSELDYLPRPMQEKLPVTEPVPGDVGAYIAHGGHDATYRRGRLGQTTSRMPVPGDDWTQTLLGGRMIRVKKLAHSEWETDYPNEGVLLLFDLALGFVPILGDALDVAEFSYALLTGKDRWGRPVSGLDLMLMGVGVMMPLVSSTALRPLTEVADDVPAPRLKARSGALSEAVDGFLIRIRPYLGDPSSGVPANKEALLEEADSFLDLRRFSDASKSSGPAHQARVDGFVEDLIANADNLRIRIDGLKPGDQTNYLTVADASRVNGQPGFIFRFLDEDYGRAASEYARHNNGAVLDLDVYLRNHARYSARAFGRAVLGDGPMGIRTKAARNVCPTLDARLPRAGAEIAFDAVPQADLVAAVIRYLQDAARGDEVMKMWGAAYGRADLAYMADVRKIAEDAGVPLGAADDITAAHPLVARLTQLIAAGDGTTADLLVAGRGKTGRLGIDEIGARVGEALLMSVDQLRHFERIDPLTDSHGLDIIRPMRKMIGDWVNGAGGVYEHALKAELRVSVQVQAGRRAINAGEAPDHLDALSGAQVEVFTQARLVGRSGVANQMGADEVIYITANGQTRAFDWQVKSSSALSRVSGYVAGDFLASSFPRLVKKVQDGVTTWDVKGGSEIFRQVAKQRLRKAHYRGGHPSHAVAGDPPIPGANGIPSNVSVPAGHRHVFTIDSEQLIDHLIDRMLQVLPDTKAVTAQHLDLLKADDRYLLEAIYKDDPTDAWPGPVDLTDAETFYDRFLGARGDIAQTVATRIEGYEDQITGFRDALRQIGGDDVADSPPEQFYLRWTNDDDMLQAMDFLARDIVGGD